MSARAHQDNFVADFPFGKVLVCSLMYFVSSFCSSWVLGEVSELTFSIMSTMKRVVIIFGAVVYFGNPVTFQSIFGMALAVRNLRYESSASDKLWTDFRLFTTDLWGR